MWHITLRGGPKHGTLIEYPDLVDTIVFQIPTGQGFGMRAHDYRRVGETLTYVYVPQALDAGIEPARPG